MRSLFSAALTPGLSTTLAALALLVSCAESESSITITGSHIGEGTVSEDMFACEWNPGSGDSRIASPIYVDLSRLADVGHAPFLNLSPATHPVGTLVAVLGLGNNLSQEESSSSLNVNQNGIYIDAVSLNWTRGGQSVYRPGQAVNPQATDLLEACQGDGRRDVSVYIDPSVASTPVDVELLTDKVSTSTLISSSEFDCLRGDLATATNQRVSSPTRYVVEVQAQGETVAGVNVESPILKIPVVLCDGCADQFASSLSFAGIPSGATPMCLIGQ